MAEINWNLLNSGPDALQMFQYGAQLGSHAREGKEKRDTRKAFATLAQNPDDPNAWNAYAQYDPQGAMQYKQQQAKLAQDQKAAQVEQVKTMAGLLEGARDEQTYQQGLAAAKQLGMDTSKAPPNFDPAWVNQNKLIARVFLKDNGQTISGIARELIDAGYKPETPEFAEAMKGVIQNKYASDYVDEQGNTRRRSALALPGGPAASGPQPQSGQPVQIATPEDYAKLPPGQVYIDPNGQIRTKAGGGVGNGTGGFRP